MRKMTSEKVVLYTYVWLNDKSHYKTSISLQNKNHVLGMASS